MHTSSRTLTLSGLVVAALAMSACSTGAADTESVAQNSPAAPASTAASGSPSASGTTAERQEVGSLTPRVVLSYDGGLMTVDAESGEVIQNTEHEGFLRLNNAGDGRHVLVSDSDVFRLFDTGLIDQTHGDHSHYYEQAPALADTALDAPEAAHVVVHEGRTALFADGTGAIQIMDSAAFSDGVVEDDEVEEHATEAPHHGVAVPLTDGNLLLTQGTEDSRDTVQVVTPEGEVVAETTDCPGVHGEAAAAPTGQGDVVTLGCENGPVIYRDGAFHKVAVEEDYQRSGNQFGSHGSPIVLADYKTDPDAEQERPTRIGLIDTRTDSISTVDLGSAYWFRSLARGPEGEALVLTYDGQLNILDADTGEILHEVDVVGAWQEPEEWQEPGPAVKVAGDRAYVTDAAAQQLHLVDIAAGTVVDSFDLPETPIEIAVVDGDPEAPAEAGHEGHDHADGEHEGHDH
ncbi:hypothetical protein [Kocuria sp. NPDC057446]|uniref:hypothetical protein n=1 Tax=Kocuria sp. NPDC057446 TaxID=3346137 RepID=UPI0036AD61C3